MQWLGLARGQAAMAGGLKRVQEEEMSCFSAILCKSTSHGDPQSGKTPCQGKDTQPGATVPSLAALHGGETSTHDPALPQEVWFKEGKEMRWKRAGGRLIYCWGAASRPMGKASIRARERLPLFTEKLSGKHMGKVIWSVCKNSSMFPFSSHSVTAWKLPSEETMPQGKQQEEAEQTGREALQGAEISCCSVSVGIPAALHHREVGTLLCLPLHPFCFTVWVHTSATRAVKGNSRYLKNPAGQFQSEEVWNG